MKMYFEMIFVLNFLLDFMILYGTKRILKISKSILRVLLGSLIGAFTTIFLFIKISSFSLFLIKVLFSFLLVMISFGFFNLLKNVLYFYLLSMILGGTFYLFDFPTSITFSYLFLLIGSFFIITILIKEFLSYRETYRNKYLVTIFYQKKKYCLEGFVDTGNRLVSPYKKESVILVNLKISPKKVLYVPYKALNTSGVVACIKPDRVLINNHEFHHCLVGLASDTFSLKGVNCILPNCFKEELC